MASTEEVKLITPDEMETFRRTMERQLKESPTIRLVFDQADQANRLHAELEEAKRQNRLLGQRAHTLAIALEDTVQIVARTEPAHPNLQTWSNIIFPHALSRWIGADCQTR